MQIWQMYADATNRPLSTRLLGHRHILKDSLLKKIQTHLGPFWRKVIG